ncbi:MAG: hypothetical protein Q8N18_24505 [Opitutaceae bacterium]|nr:hypothetical protein [Opitutaceae bacterium]
MSASKKTKSTPAKSPAPATKPAPAKPAAKAKAAVPAKAAAPAKAVVPAKPAKAAVPVAPAARPAPVAVKPVARKPVLTIISARADVGFGNALYLRGEGAGLSWDRGLMLECIEADLWRITLPESAHGHTFKFLVNDLSWSTGPDYTVPGGAEVTLTPEF